MRRFSAKRLLCAFGIVLVGAFAAGLFGYSCAGTRAMRREVAAADRDPTTGIIRGAEPRSLGPRQADTACLLLHGFVGSPIDFADLGQRLAAEGFHVRMALAPGHGTSPEELARTTLEELIEAARTEYLALADRFDEVYVVGFSMGGAMATLLAAEQEVPRLVLVSPYYRVTYFWYYGLPPSVWNRIFSPAVPYLKKGERFTKVNRPDAKQQIFAYETVPSAGVNLIMELARRARDPRLVARVESPLLLVHSRGDEAAAPEAAARAFEGFASKNKKIYWVNQRSNHHIFWDYDRESAVDRIVEFLIEGRDDAPEGAPSAEALNPRAA